MSDFFVAVWHLRFISAAVVFLAAAAFAVEEWMEVR